MITTPKSIARPQGFIRHLLLLLLTLLPAPLLAQFNYTVSGGTATITRYTGAGGHVDIPATLGGFPVTHIGGWSFRSRNNVTGITIPDTVTRIGTNAFERCFGLTQVFLPDGVVQMDDGVFAGCHNLTNIHVSPTHPAFASLEGVLFNKDQQNLIQFPPGRRGDYSIPDGVSSVRNMAFTGSTSLVHLTIPSSVTNLGLNVFGDCSGLESAILSSNLKSLPERAFSQCIKLASITIPNGITNIGRLAFYHTALTNLNLPEGLAVIELAGFAECTALDTVTFPTSLRRLDSSAFQDCTRLSKVEFPMGITELGSSAFDRCSGLTNVHLPESVIVVGSGAFSSCLNLASFQIPSGVSTLEGTFARCASLSQVNIPEGVTNIGGHTFSDCISLTNLPLPGNLSLIGWGAFSGSGLTHAELPASLVSVGSRAFADCASLTNIWVDPANSTYRSFDGVLFDKSLNTLIQFPKGRRGSYEIPLGVSDLGDDAFASAGLLTHVTIPSSVTRLGYRSFFGCIGLSTVTIPNTVASLGYECFGECTELTSVYFLGDAPSAPENVFFANRRTIIYYLDGSSGFGPLYGDRPTQVWTPQAQDPGLVTDHFEATVTGPSTAVIIMEASTTLNGPTWQPVATNAIGITSSTTLRDPNSSQSTSQFYRFRSE